MRMGIEGHLDHRAGTSLPSAEQRERNAPPPDGARGNDQQPQITEASLGLTSHVSHHEPHRAALLGRTLPTAQAAFVDGVALRKHGADARGPQRLIASPKGLVVAATTDHEQSLQRPIC